MRLEVLANLAHELRTPLQVLIGYLDILRDEWAEKFDPEPRAMLERMNSNLHDLYPDRGQHHGVRDVGGWLPPDAWKKTCRSATW